MPFCGCLNLVEPGLHLGEMVVRLGQTAGLGLCLGPGCSGGRPWLYVLVMQGYMVEGCIGQAGAVLLVIVLMGSSHIRKFDY
jgi:hypothetical protein